MSYLVVVVVVLLLCLVFVGIKLRKKITHIEERVEEDSSRQRQIRENVDPEDVAKFLRESCNRAESRQRDFLSSTLRGYLIIAMGGLALSLSYATYVDAASNGLGGLQCWLVVFWVLMIKAAALVLLAKHMVHSGDIKRIRATEIQHGYYFEKALEGKIEFKERGAGAYDEREHLRLIKSAAKRKYVARVAIMTISFIFLIGMVILAVLGGVVMGGDS